MCGYGLRNLTDLDTSFSEMARILRPGGRLALLEVGDPPASVLRVGYRVWFEHVVPFIGAVISDGKAYRYLPRSTAYLPDRAELRRMLIAAGFATVGHRFLSGGLSQLFTATRTGLPCAR